jgi:5-methyltetrahydrofolate corrinoid/iron sulfur protein methyltransferase
MKLIADNLRITKPEIREALKARDPGPIQEMVKRCAAQRPFALDVNTGPLGKNPEADMRFFIEAAETVTTLPLLIDTSNPSAMRVGLEAAKNRVIINGFSLEPRKLEQILPLAKEFDADIVGFLLYPDSRVPKNEAERFEIALELMDQAERAGVAKEQVILDPVVPPLAWADGLAQARAVLNVIHTLPEMLGFAVRTMGGISNLGTGAGDKAKRRLLEQSYMAMLASAGLDFALMDILDAGLVQSARVSGLLVKEEIFSWAMVPGHCEEFLSGTKSNLINPNSKKG